MNFQVAVLLLLAFAVVTSTASAQEVAKTDWPQILGGNRNGVSAEGMELDWKKEPSPVWQVDVGEGFSGPVISGDHLILFHRPRGPSATMVVQKFDLSKGKSIWKAKIRSQYEGKMDGDGGPKATPVIQDGFVYCHGPDGELACVDFETGKTKWEINARRKFKAPSGYFGCGSSPVVVDGKVLLNVGGKDGAAVVAFDASSGEVLWKAVDDTASYSSPIVVEHDGKKLAVFLTRTKFVGLDVSTGEVQFSNEFGVRGPTAVAAVPVAFGSKIFANAAYNVGATVVDLANIPERGGSIEPDWSSENAFASHYGTPVFREGHFYGTSGREDMRNGSFRCIDAATGDIKWDQPSFPVGHTLLIGDQLLILDHKGKLTLAKANADKFNVLKTATIFRGATRAIPAFSNGRLFFRSNAKSRVGKLIAIEVAK